MREKSALRRMVSGEGEDKIMLLISFGTRPEYIKIKPLLSVLKDRVEYKLLFTGQHEDLLKHISGSDVERMRIGSSGNRLDAIVSAILSQERAPSFENVSHVLVQGDTTSAFSVALTAFHRKIQVIHLEAGLRTYDLENPYPEEFNRQAIARLAHINLCPTDLSAQNLANERVSGAIHVIGNTVLDNLVGLEPSYENKVVITMHRRENHSSMRDWFEAIDRIASKNKNLEFILPIHPNPEVNKHRDIFKHVQVVEPMGYEKFIELLAASRLIITDSGGLQEESSFLRKKSVVCRKTTERTEGLEHFAILCETPDLLLAAFEQINADPVPNSSVACPYGDGHASSRAARIIQDDMDMNRGRGL